MGRYLVTQEQWAAVMGSLPACRFRGARRPVENVAWQEGVEFCRRLAGKTGREVGLSSEAQWEYACRAGTVTPFSCGETITGDLADYVAEYTYADGPPGVYRHGTTDVGAFPANPFGLCDMHGLLWEFCADAWRADYGEGPSRAKDEPAPVAPARPVAPVVATDQAREAAGASRFGVARGGSWHDGPDLCRSAARLRVDPEYGDDFFGLRVAAPL
jgi:formylglycine-generating enzyme required for sulfatase activity